MFHYPKIKKVETILRLQNFDQVFYKRSHSYNSIAGCLRDFQRKQKIEEIILTKHVLERVSVESCDKRLFLFDEMFHQASTGKETEQLL